MPRPAPEPAISATEGDAIPRHELLRELVRGETPPPKPLHPSRNRRASPARADRPPGHRGRTRRPHRSPGRTAHAGFPSPYNPPPIDLLDAPEAHERRIDYEELEANKRILLDKLATYNIEITSINAIVGPTVTLYELTPAPGVKISKITSLEDDLAMALAAPGIRMIAPIPGKSAIGVEIPNRHRELVRIRDVIGTARFRDAQMELPIALGKTIEGEVYLQDLTRLPHLLIAGATGSGKSVGLNALITGLLYACHPANLKFVMIDPKKIELQQYAAVVDHFLAMPEGAEEPIITDFTQALSVLKSCEKEMELRYDLLSKAGVRSIKDYNRRLKEGALSPDEGHRHLPYIVVIIDELADLMMTAGKDIEGPIARLAQMARAVGIHLVLATQRPSVDVITGLIKANFPARIAYQVATKVDSRTILDQNGAEGLVGNGDLLFMMGSQLVRLQGPFVSIDEVERVTRFIAEQPGPGPYWLPSIEDERNGETTGGGSSDSYDELFEEAARIIVRSQQGSVSLLQRKLSIGYTRAARIVDQLEEAGIVVPSRAPRPAACSCRAKPNSTSCSARYAPLPDRPEASPPSPFKHLGIREPSRKGRHGTMGQIDVPEVVYVAVRDEQIRRTDHTVVATGLLDHVLRDGHRRRLAFGQQQWPSRPIIHHQIGPSPHTLIRERRLQRHQRGRTLQRLHQILGQMLPHPLFGRQAHPAPPQRIEQVHVPASTLQPERIGREVQRFHGFRRMTQGRAVGPIPTEDYRPDRARAAPLRSHRLQTAQPRRCRSAHVPHRPGGRRVSAARGRGGPAPCRSAADPRRHTGHRCS